MNRPTEHVVAELAELGARTGLLARHATRHIGSNATRYRIAQLTQAHADILEAMRARPTTEVRTLRSRITGWVVMLKASLAPQPETVYLSAMSDCQKRFKFLTRTALEQTEIGKRCGTRARRTIERSLGHLDRRL